MCTRGFVDHLPAKSFNYFSLSLVLRSQCGGKSKEVEMKTKNEI